MKRGDIATDTTETHRVMEDDCDQLFANKADDLEEMDQFLGTYYLPRLN